MKLANRLLSVLLALALLILAVLVLIEIGWAFGFGGGTEVLLPYPAAADYLAQQTWDNRAVRTICVLLVLVGAALVVLELRRRRPGLLALASSGGPVTTGVDRRSVQKAAAAAATEVEGISTARARISRRRISIAADSGVRDQTGLQEALDAHLSAWVADLALADAPAVSVTVRPGRSQ